MKKYSKIAEAAIHKAQAKPTNKYSIYKLGQSEPIQNVLDQMELKTNEIVLTEEIGKIMVKQPFLFTETKMKQLLPSNPFAV